MEYARKCNADLLLVTDSDCDRVGIAEHWGQTQCGQLKPRMLKIQRFWAYILDFFI